MTGDPFYDGLPDVVDTAPVRCEPGQQLAPAQFSKRLVCAAKRKPCKLCGKPKTNKIHKRPSKTEEAECPFKRQNGCAICGKALNHEDHIGAPESFNVFASGSWEAYQAAKQRWHKVLAPLLRESGLPRGCAYILAEGECSFGDDRPRDQGNHRVVFEKALGDVLVEEGYLPGDKWHQYEFGGLVLNERGVNEIRVTLFPRAPAVPEPPAQGSLLG